MLTIGTQTNNNKKQVMTKKVVTTSKVYMLNPLAITV